MFILFPLFKQPASKQRQIRSAVTVAPILAAVNFSILADNPSGPVALLMSTDNRR